MYGVRKIGVGKYEGRIGKHIYRFEKVGSKWIWTRSDGIGSIEKFETLRDAVMSAKTEERAELDEAMFYTWC